MISKQKQKFIKSLQLKKYRKQSQNFLIEGEKSVVELLHSQFKINTIIATKPFIEGHQDIFSGKTSEIIEVSDKLLNQLSSLTTNTEALAVADIPEDIPFSSDSQFYIPVYENLQDPGNLGTIIRICDWYGLEKIILSEDSVDCFNPKVIQASMGSFTRVKAYYINIHEYIQEQNNPVIGTTLSGEDLYEFNWPEKGLILFGNESKGISSKLEKKLDRKVTIPKVGNAESLNVGTASAVIIDNIIRSTR